VQALEGQLASAKKFHTAEYKDRRAAESRLAAIHQRILGDEEVLLEVAHDAYGKAVNEGLEPAVALEHVVIDLGRYLLGEDATEAAKYPPEVLCEHGAGEGAECYVCHPPAAPEPTTEAPRCTCEPGKRRADCPALVGEPRLWCCGGTDEHPPQHTRECYSWTLAKPTPEPSTAERLLSEEREASITSVLRAAQPTTVELFATVRGPLSDWQRGCVVGSGNVDRAAYALALLEHRMGALARALSDAVSAMERAEMDVGRIGIDGPIGRGAEKDVLDGLSSAAEAARAALTDAPEVYTREEVEDVCDAVYSDCAGDSGFKMLAEVKHRLSAMRK
jgi:hypothetical protein